MDNRQDTTVEALLEHLIEHGPDDIGTVFARAFELAMRIERERFLRARAPEPVQTTDGDGRVDTNERDPRRTCPECGGAMRVIETFTRGQTPKSRAPPWEDAA